MINEESPNLIIPKLIKGSQDYTFNMNNRLRVNSIFSEFDQIANNTFGQFVDMSNSRYKSVKCGNGLENILLHQRKKYTNIAEQVNEDDIYINNNEIDKERKKLLINTGVKKTKELHELRDQLRISTKDFTKMELRLRERLNQQIKKKKMRTNELKTENETQTNDKNISAIRVLTDREQTEENEIFVKELVDNDKKFIENNLNEYSKYLKVLQQSIPEGKKIPAKKEILESMPHTQLVHDSINFLHFQETKPPVIVVKKKVNNIVDVNKLMRFTKKGKEELKRLNLTSENKTEEKTSTNVEPQTTSTGTNNNSKYKTVNIVKTEANNCLYLDENFSQRRDKIEKKIGVQLPRLEEYEGK